MSLAAPMSTVRSIVLADGTNCRLTISATKSRTAVRVTHHLRHGRLGWNWSGPLSVGPKNNLHLPYHLILPCQPSEKRRSRLFV